MSSVKKSAMRFPQKLWKLVNKCDNIGPIRWSADGMSILINYTDFQAQYLNCLNPVFKTRNISSFVRQLNFYGFKKINTAFSKRKGTHQFMNKKFQRGREDLLALVVRRLSANKDDLGPERMSRLVKHHFKEKHEPDIEMEEKYLQEAELFDDYILCEEKKPCTYTNDTPEGLVSIGDLLNFGSLVMFPDSTQQEARMVATDTEWNSFLEDDADPLRCSEILDPSLSPLVSLTTFLEEESQPVGEEKSCFMTDILNEANNLYETEVLPKRALRKEQLPKVTKPTSIPPLNRDECLRKSVPSAGTGGLSTITVESGSKDDSCSVIMSDRSGCELVKFLRWKTIINVTPQPDVGSDSFSSDPGSSSTSESP